MKDGLYYLAVPYQGTEQQKKYRMDLSLKTAVECLRHGIHLFAPIIYVNKIVEELGLSSIERRREIVMPYLFDFLKASKGMILVEAEGWQKSWGIQQELKFCFDVQIPVYTMKPELNGESLREVLSNPLNKDQLKELLEENN